MLLQSDDTPSDPAGAAALCRPPEAHQRLQSVLTRRDEGARECRPEAVTTPYTSYIVVRDANVTPKSRRVPHTVLSEHTYRDDICSRLVLPKR